jgi:hypothetical protein
MHLRSAGMRRPLVATAVLAASMALTSSIPAGAGTAPTAHVVATFPGAIQRVAAGERAVFVLYVSGFGSATPHIGRFDRRTGQTTQGPSLAGADDLVVAGGNVWVTGGGSEAGSPATRYLYEIDPSSLAILDRVTLPTAPYRVIATGTGVPRTRLWVGASDALYRFDPFTRRIRLTVRLRGAIGELSLDPQSHLAFYDSTHPVGDLTVMTIQQRTVRSGELVASSGADRGDVAMNALAAAPDGVWAAVATGMLGNAQLFRRGDLHVVSGANAQGANGLRADFVDGILWLPDGMTGRLRCADPDTGRTRASVPRVGPNHHDAYGPNVVMVKDGIYTGTLQGALVRVHPGTACTG